MFSCPYKQLSTVVDYILLSYPYRLLQHQEKHIGRGSQTEDKVWGLETPNAREGGT